MKRKSKTAVETAAPPRDKLMTRKQIINRYGLTVNLIKKHFPAPKYPNKNSPQTPYYWKSDVLAAMQTEAFQKDWKNVQQQRERTQLEEQKKKQKLFDALFQYDLTTLIENARELDRRFVLHCGPTNSGKTYQAIEALKRAKSGVYLGPLRLLALEVFDTLNMADVPCDLLTGEESIEIPFAKVTASTIEMLNTNERYDVAVIDEAQLIADSDRGGAWTKAVLGVNAMEVHLCFPPDALPFYENLLSDCQTEYEVVMHERLTPLVYAGSTSLQKVSDGDCFVCFSRKMVLNVAAVLERKYHVAASVIYGALPPAARREEVRKFESGETTVVVATDAIGMGVSLPIKRVIFCETEKFDGTSRRPLTANEVRQIAGRAGRYGKFDQGEVLVIGHNPLVKKLLNEPTKPIQKIVIPFPAEAANSTAPMDKLLAMWKSRSDTAYVKYEDISDAQFLYKELGQLTAKMTQQQIYTCIRCPVDIRNLSLVHYWRRCCIAYIGGRKLPYPDAGMETLEDCELQYKEYDVLHQMLRRCGEERDTSAKREALCKKINEFLQNKKNTYVNRCRHCRRELPYDYRFGLCEDCFHELQWGGLPYNNRDFWD